MSVALGTHLVTPAKDGKIKGPDGKKSHSVDGKSAKVDGGREPVVVEPGNKLVKCEFVLPKKGQLFI